MTGPTDPVGSGTPGEPTPAEWSGYDPNQPYAAPPPGYDPNQPYAAPPPGYDPNQPPPAPPAYPGYAAPYGGYGQPGQPGPLGQPGQDPNQYGFAPAVATKKSRKPLWITLIVVALLIVGGGVTLAVLVSKNSGSAESAVKDYLTALSTNDAKGALNASALQPSSTTFVTNEVLTKQQSIAKISNIKVTKVSGSSTQAMVHATYTFGTQNAEETYAVSKVGGEWRIATATLPIDVSTVDDIPGLTLFGTEVKGLGKVFVFPGPLQWGTSNPDYTVTDKDAEKFAVSPESTTWNSFTLDYDLSDSGQQKIVTAVDAYLQQCAAVKTLEPQNCPQRVYDFEAVEGTATWKITSDVTSSLKYSVNDDDPTKVDVTADVKWGVTYQSKDFEGKVTTHSDTDNSTIYGSVDISASPPTFTPD
ncbi:uncharacterized protein DUF4878 [Jatrophihabitans sp. GAS493]|uniref:Rv0361 family membrane protein n=1 Tax=Jatrophihabitans sp. GAS493 TaxID=1907575 RepID=UPI000BB88284|nr:DUF4878 domain-containing protein [Jatrophihabitans sp. GAS493]SOD71832.1 uncharacterized protein DUF4878 [Jatrophihabitans sp. GAS493]